MKITIEGTQKEIAEMLATLRQEKKVITYGDITGQYGNQPVSVSSLELPVVVALSELEANQKVYK